MPDNIERTIYQLDMDEDGYIQGIERTVASTIKLSQAQEQANARLRTNQEALRGATANLARARAELENYTGSNQRYRAQLENDVSKIEKRQAALTELVKRNQKAYEDATRAAQGFFVAAGQPATQPAPKIPTVQNLPAPGVSNDLRELAAQIQAISGQDISNVFDIAAGEMDAFKLAIAAAEEALDNMTHTEKEFNEEFKNLSIVVSEGNKIIEEFDKQTAEAARSSLGYRQQITQLHKELSILESANKQETAEYVEKQRELVKLKRAYADQQQTIRILASETRALDFGKAAITTATSAFQTWTSVAILAGGASEDLQKKTFQLFAAMQLITSLEQLNNNLKRVSVLRLNALSAAQSIYTAAVGASTGALRAFRIALLATGVGAVLVGVGLLVARYLELSEATKEAREEQKLLNEVNGEAIKSFTAEVTHLNLIKTKLNDLTIPQKERIKLAKEYNKTADEGNKIDLAQIDNIQLVNLAIDTHIAKIKERARARAAENVITKAQEEVFLEEEAAKLRAEETAKAITDPTLIDQSEADQRPRESILQIDQATGKIIARAATQEEQVADRINSLKDRDPKLKAAKDRLQKALSTLGVFITPESLVTVTGGGGAKEVENIFEQERDRLLDRLRQLAIEEEIGIKRINDEFVFKMEQEKKRVSKLLKDKKITAGQALQLIDLAAQINKQEFDAAIEQFNKSVLQKREKLNDDLADLQFKNTVDQINLIEDEYERRAALIEVNEKRELEEIKKQTSEKLKAASELFLASSATGVDTARQLENNRQFQNDKNRIEEEGQIAQNNIVLRYAQERQRLSIDSFQSILENFDNVLADSKLVGDKAALEEIRALVQVFQAGKISYEQYKKDLAAIQKKYEDAQLQKTIDTLQEELRALRRNLAGRIDITVEQYDALIKVIRQKEQELVNAQTKQATGQGEDARTPKQVTTVAEYADAIGQLTESIIAFWQKANEAEAAALDRSIELQERRVSEARRIAERGNASYLKMEEDQLKQLQVARENAARREIAINAAVQASQLMVGITGAIAKIAKGGIGVAETIASIAVIAASLAAGFALVKSLQANQPRFAKGEKYVKRKPHEQPGTDTVQAWLTEGEAVITKDKNKAYHPVIEAIHDGTIPPEYLNKQVEKYHKNKQAPQINYKRVGDAVEMSVSNDGKLVVLLSEQNRKLDENNMLQRRVLEAMKNMSIDARIDKNGVAIAVNEYIKKMQIDKFV